MWCDKWCFTRHMWWITKMLQSILKDSRNPLLFHYLKAPSYPSYLSFPFSHLFCPALSPTHRPHRFTGNPGWLAPGTQLCEKNSPTAKHCGKQQIKKTDCNTAVSLLAHHTQQQATDLGVSHTAEVWSGLSPSALLQGRSIQLCDRTQCDTIYGLADRQGFWSLGCSFSPRQSHSRRIHRGPLEKKVIDDSYLFVVKSLWLCLCLCVVLPV